MPAYVTLASVKAKLPGSLPTALSDARITILLGEASSECDDLVGSEYSRQFASNTQKFPDITESDPTTPATINLCALWLTLARCYEELGEDNRGVEGGREKSNKVYYRELAEKKLELVRTGQIDLNLGEYDKTSKWEAYDKYPDDESGMDRVFTNDAMDAHY